jgi:hypothetical protein
VRGTIYRRLERAARLADEDPGPHSLCPQRSSGVRSREPAGRSRASRFKPAVLARSPSATPSTEPDATWGSLSSGTAPRSALAPVQACADRAP